MLRLRLYTLGAGNLTMDSCVVSNTNYYGVYIRKSSYWSYNAHCSVKDSNFTQVGQRPLYIESSKVNVAFSRFHHNVCDNCITAEIRARKSVLFHANHVKANSASDILKIESVYGENDFYANIIGNIFQENTVPAS